MMKPRDIDFDHLKTKKILLAEDVELNQYLAKHFLESRGLEVSIANNGFEALALLNQRSFDFILMDIQMPVLDGIQTAKQIRGLSDPIKSSIPIIALTANVLSEDIEKYKAAGMNDFLAKPFDECALMMVISRNQVHKPVENTGNAQGQTQDSPAGNVKLYDLSIVQSVSGGDNAFIKKMVLLFMETVPQNVNELTTALKSENWEQVGKMAHKLKSTVDSMGIKSIHSDIRTVESNAKQQKNLSDIPGLTSRIESIINQCIGQLQEDIP
jgi:CheY-like chemotaxis protein/HPt (histidine-containing phosphotransfer) domain-containing protein